MRASDGGVRKDEEAFPFPKEEDAPNNRLSEPVESIGGSKPDARPSDDEVKAEEKEDLESSGGGTFDTFQGQAEVERENKPAAESQRLD